MSELPKGWVETTIGVAVLNVNNLREPISLKKRSEIQGQYPYYGATGQIDSLNDFTHEGDHILVGEDGANLLSKSKPLAFIAKGKYWVNNHAHSLRSLANMPSLYICLYIDSLDLTPWVTGSAQPKLTRGNLDKIPLPLAPLAEQKRIVEKLDQVLAQVDTIKARLDGIPAILKRFRQSVLAAAVSGKLSEGWRKKTHLSLSSWSFEAAEKACTKVQSGSTPRNNPFDQGGTIPFLKVYNIVEQEISFDYKPQFVTKDVHSGALGRSIALPNDVLMNIVGPPLGKVAILTDQFPEWNINQAITLFRTDENTLSHKFLYYVLREGELVRKVMPDTKGSVGQVNISLSQCRNAIIPVPSLKEQTEIVRLVDQYFAFADTIEQQVQKAQQRVDKLTQSILAKAFRGELVPQDPTDEPADELLKRIAAARAESDALAKAAKKVGKKTAK
ncbi:restriction endonuclease subunit S [Marinomonas aquiplantarum]|uniref:Type I restriction enzyme S subunit n=1 Tax=Marinomonas aquiplantarum TaxID=491951 RepID=A0A366D2H5_9GAMM|nr:restriction endonuclease subunit S [Marinomonas aquiplantarum]RBO83478.1 type I restriction enzyme S subunit [Marinomonas aquiplantarum]